MLEDAEFCDKYFVCTNGTVSISFAIRSNI
jgi:hypothetical protein